MQIIELNKNEQEWVDAISNGKVRDFLSLSSNLNITKNVVLTFPGLPWNDVSLVQNPNFTLEDILDLFGYMTNIDHFISKNPNITWDLVCKHPDIKWDYRMLSSHIDPQVFFNNPKKFFSYQHLSSNPKLTIQDIINYKHKNWNFNLLSKNPGIKYTDILDNPKLGLWNYKYISENPNLRIQDILNFPEKSWDMFEFSNNPSLSWSDVLNNPELNWNFTNLSSNPCVNIDIIKKYPNSFISSYFKDEQQWSYFDFNTNPTVTWKIVNDNPKFPWYSISLCKNNMSKDWRHSYTLIYNQKKTFLETSTGLLPEIKQFIFKFI